MNILGTERLSYLRHKASLGVERGLPQAEDLRDLLNTIDALRAQLERSPCGHLKAEMRHFHYLGGPEGLGGRECACTTKPGVDEYCEGCKREADARNEMLGAITCSLVSYPNGGGDIGVMKEVVRIEADAVRMAITAAADICKKYIDSYDLSNRLETKIRALAPASQPTTEHAKEGKK